VGTNIFLTITPQFSYLYYKGRENLPNGASVIRPIPPAFLHPIHVVLSSDPGKTQAFPLLQHYAAPSHLQQAIENLFLS